MKKAFLFLFFHLLVLTFISVGVAAQDPAPPTPPPAEQAKPEEQTPADPCPKIVLKAPERPVKDGTSVKLTANLTGGDKKVAPMFDWSLSAGVIRLGQGTPSIEVDTSGAGDDRAIYATLLIGGYSPECSSSENAVIKVAGPAKMVDEFGAMPESELSTKIQSTIASLPAEDQLHIIGYAGRKDVRGFTSSTLRLIRAAAIKAGISTDRLATVDGGYREEPVFELWMVPLGADAPSPSPTISARDIVFAKTPPIKTKKP